MANRDTSIEIKGINQLLKALSKIDKDLQQEVRDASGAIATDLASGARNLANTPLQTMVVSGIKVRRDRIPAVTTRGSVRAGVPTRAVFYGAEFGGQRRPTTRQFLPHRGRNGYFLYPTARAHGKRYADMWADAIDKAFEAWNYRAPQGP